MQADAVVLALGQDTDSGFLRQVPGIEFKRDGTVIVGPDMMTGASGIFAGGDMVPSERTVTVAVGHGKLAARNIDAWLRGAQLRKRAASTPVVTFAMLHLPVFSDADPTAQRELPLAERTDGFDEVIAGLTEARGALRGAALPVLRQLLRVRQLLSPPAPKRRSSSSGPASAIATTMQNAPAARCASNSARATPSK